ncbi:MAG TPA: ABC transporter permease [Candidatus Sulfopaludibacter sp.]|nr:ABC transporter permease [Candidatus Sulfopaludibacter sp.]
MSYRRLRAVLIKELHHITRDARSLGLALAVPVMMLLLYGYALSLDVDRVPTLIYDQDGSTASRALIREFQGSRYFEIRGIVNSYAPIERGIDKNEILMGVTIPRDYGKLTAAGREAPVQILLDGSDSNTASIVLGYAESVVRGYSLQLRTDMQNRRGGERATGAPVDAQMRVWYNSSLESKNYVVPGLIAVVLQIVTALLTSLTIAREWEMGTMEQVLSTPLRPTEMVLGKMAAYFLVGLADAVMAVLAGVFVFEVPLRGSIFMMAASLGVFLVGVLFWGIFVSAASKSQLQAYQMGILSSFLPAFLLSGFVYEIQTMPWIIRVITHIVPARYVVTTMKGIFLKGVGLEVLWGELGFLMLYAAIVFLAAVRKVNQKLA